MKPQPIWQDLPFQFQQNVVKLLDFKSRISLQKCSKSDQNVVLSVPVSLFNVLVVLTPEPEDADPALEIPKIELLVMEKPFSESLHWKKQTEDQTIDNLQFIFKNPKLKVKEMIFTTNKNPAKFIGKLLEKPENLKFHVERLFWKCKGIGKTTGEVKNCLKFFKLFDAELLEKLELSFPQKSSKLVGELMKTEQFQRLTEIFINTRIENNQLENVLYAERLKIQLEKLIVEDLKKVIEVYLIKNLASYFRIESKTPFEKEPILEMFKSIPNNSSIPTSSFYEPGIHTHRFEIMDRKTENDEALLLYMKIGNDKVWGVICRVDHLNSDRNKCMFY